MIKELEDFIDDLNGKDIRVAVAEAVLEGVEEYVPYRSGKLSGSGKAGDGFIDYAEPYATAVYENKRGVKFSKRYHSKATEKWIEKGYEANKREILQRVQNAIDSKR